MKGWCRFSFSYVLLLRCASRYGRGTVAPFLIVHDPQGGDRLSPTADWCNQKFESIHPICQQKIIFRIAVNRLRRDFRRDLVYLRTAGYWITLYVFCSIALLSQGAAGRGLISLKDPFVWRNFMVRALWIEFVCKLDRFESSYHQTIDQALKRTSNGACLYL